MYVCRSNIVFGEWEYTRHEGYPGMRGVLVNALQQKAEYWGRALMGAPAVFKLPVDYARPDSNPGVRGWVACDLDPSLYQSLYDYCNGAEGELLPVVAMAWVTVLSRLSGHPDVVLGVSACGWGDTGQTADMVFPLRVDASAEPTTSELLSSVKNSMQAALQHLDVELSGVLARSWPALAATGATGLQLGLVWHARDKVAVALTANAFAYELSTPMALQSAELVLHVVHANGALQARLEYAVGLFQPGSIQSYLGYLKTVLHAMAAADLRPVHRLPLLSTLQREQALERWNDTVSDFPAGLCIHQLFEAQVARDPDAIALVHEGKSINYGQLNRDANKLAHFLRAAGIKPDDRIAIHVERGMHMVLGLLASLKAGAAYVPLDPTYPIERLSYTLHDSRPAVLLTQGGMEYDWQALQGGATLDIRVLDLADAMPPWSGFPEHDPDADSIGLSPRHLAYVLYTSGSTGQPKGVAMPHAPLVNLICWQLQQPGAVVAQRTLQFAALGFDVAFQETFATLCNGGCLFLIDQDTRLSAGKLFQYLVDHRIERIFLPYFALQMLAEGLDNHVATLADGQAVECALREVITAGEQLRIEPKIASFFQRIPGCRLHNHYGPTESHVVTALSLPEDPASWPRLPSIGRPIANARVYVLDKQGEPVAQGVVGELYLAGPVLARGYLQRDDLTAERFLPDPFRSVADARMYKTGDLGRWLVDGTLEFLGRSDFQVKVRGFRVELGEIEAQIMAFPGVREAGVLAREDSPDLKRLVAYFSPVDAARPVDVEGLRRHLIAQLPDYMVPVAYVALDTLPLSPNGKLDRRALPAPGRERPDWAGSYEPASGAMEQALCRLIAELLDLENIGRNDNFFDLGGSSLLAVRLLENIRREGLGEISTMTLFRDPSPAALAHSLEQGARTGIEPSRMTRQHRVGDEDPIAIVAMAGRFPGAADVEAFWENLCEGRDSISVFAADTLDPSIPESLRADPGYVPARGVIDGVENFDAVFFGISPREAELMDPQQRIFMELCWECIERAGHVPDATSGPVGVFAGMYNASYYQRNVLAHPELIDKVGEFQVMLGNEKDYIATRVAHKLNLTGPAVSVHTACSTSLVAICQAIDSLRAGQCDMALAGGIAITCPVRSGYLYQEGAMLSPDGHTRSFDAEAQGTVFSDGAAVVLLKRLSDARADGNPIYALIRGGAINNDGGSKASFTAPSSEGQAAVIAMAHRNAGVDARSISYVETHGTATPVGDPIEIEGLTKAFRQSTSDTGFCRVGSVKSNVGHLLMAAGAAGTIKTALALSERRIPATAHFHVANPNIDFAASPFVVNAESHVWKSSNGLPLRAAVSSFGVGGTNAHVIMEEAPAMQVSEAITGPQLLVLSARTPAALTAAAARLANHLQAHPQDNLDDVAWTLAVGRKAFAHRLSVVASSVAEAVQQLQSNEVNAIANRSRPAHAGDVVFLFPGQGSQYAGMGRELYASEPVFREAFDACLAVLDMELRLDLRPLIFGDDAEALLPTAIMQPCIFSMEYSLATWWLSQGVTPVAMIGHSVGEFVAATLAGIFTLPDALRLVARRGRMMQAQPAGSMLSVRLPWDTLMARLPTDISLAAENAPAACVVAGTHEAVAAFQVQLEAEGIAARALKTSHAFHSAMMDPVVDGFRAEVAAMPRAQPTLPIVSTATGDWLDADTAMSPDYWARHLREPVRFATALGRVSDLPSRTLLEVGPRTTLSTLSRQHPGLQQHRIVSVASLADNAEGEVTQLHAAVGQLWCRGVAVDPSIFDQRSTRLRLRLPTYPFEQQRHWVEPAIAVPHNNVVAHPAIAAREARENFMAPVSHTPVVVPVDRKPRLVAQLKEVFEDVAGFDLADADLDSNFIELGLDSLMLTQVALQLQKTFAVKITFRQLMGDCSSLGRLAGTLDAQLPQEAQPAVHAPTQAALASTAPAWVPMPAMPSTSSAGGDYVRQIIEQQMQLMAQQLALLTGGVPATTATFPTPAPITVATTPGNAMAANVLASSVAAVDEEVALAHTKYDVKKAFGAIARIDNQGGTELSDHQRNRLDGFIQRYVARSPKSKHYTQQHRAHMADPRVVTGFRPLTKEIVYQIVIDRSKGSHLWDIDGNEYVDALNGFGSSLFGWQPGFVVDAIKKQLEQGYEIGPQHPLAGEVAQLVCELTGHDRAALCNTGSEAVLGALRIARTVTGRNTVVLFSGSYHGINDEVIVRGTKKLRAVPAAPGILRNTAEHVLVLDYGTPEALQIIRERAHELAAVLVEPVQSRRPDFQPIEFLKEVREITSEAGVVLIFDEVITGFRAHPGGTQALFGIKADLATYGKVVGGGYPIGVMAGKREFMDALDGGHWQYGDDSIPTVGVTYFAGTFVRHPLTLAAAKASLLHMKQQGSTMQQKLNDRTAAMASEINAFCAEVGAPLEIRHFASMWRTYFSEDHPLQDLLFAMMRSRGIHILDNFPCFFTTAHMEADFQAIILAYKESVLELQEAGFVPRHAANSRTVMDADKPAVPGARLGRDPDGRPAWYVPHPEQPGKFVKVSG